MTNSSQKLWCNRCLVALLRSTHTSVLQTGFAVFITQVHYGSCRNIMSSTLQFPCSSSSSASIIRSERQKKQPTAEFDFCLSWNTSYQETNGVHDTGVYCLLFESFECHTWTVAVIWRIKILSEALRQLQIQDCWTHMQWPCIPTTAWSFFKFEELNHVTISTANTITW